MGELEEPLVPNDTPPHQSSPNISRFTNGTALGKALETNGALKVLNLRHNKIGDAGAQALAASVFGAMNSINLLRNSFSMEAANGLVTVLKNHKSLKSLCGLAPNQTSLLL